MKPQVICIPGSVAPAAQRYAALTTAVGHKADLHLKELEVYSGSVPPANYSIEMELAGLDRLAGSLRLQHFHLFGYSCGGVVSLSYAGPPPHPPRSLRLFSAPG